jgi:8-oxo-dGTP pyrophosphatase MutT (NUDIX family)
MATDANEPPIRDAATLIIVDRSRHVPRVLMGRRRADQVFLPNMFVFPGGRVDATDTDAKSADELDIDEARLLALPRDDHAPYPPALVRALALAALRETFEETGILAGAPVIASRGDTTANAWRPFLENGVLPALSPLRYVLRAVTPKGRPRRYDTRFFLMDADAIAHTAQATDGELSEVGWFALDELADLDVPRITRVVIGELQTCLISGLKPAAERLVPYYFEQNDVMCRAELSLLARQP